MSSETQDGPAEEFILVDELEADSPPKKRSIDSGLLRRMVLVAGAGCCAVLLLFLISRWWVLDTAEFPRLSDGSYLGKIEGLFPNDPRKYTRLYVEKLPDDEQLFVVLMRSGWHPQLIELLPASDAGGLAPVNLLAPEGKLKFVGVKAQDGSYAGTVFDVDNDTRGTWKLESIQDGSSHVLVADSRIETRLWLLLKAELNEIEGRIRAAEESVPKQRSEIERLNTYVSEGTELRDRAEEKHQQALQSLKEARAKYNKVKQEAAGLARQLDISERVTGLGKLVALSRESIDRERRWYESMYKTMVSDQSREFARAVERSEMVLDIRRRIALERDRIYSLVNETERSQSLGLNREAPR